MIGTSLFLLRERESSLLIWPFGIRFLDMFCFYQSIIKRIIASTYTVGLEGIRRKKSKIIVVLLLWVPPPPAAARIGAVLEISNQIIHLKHNFTRLGAERTTEEEGLCDTRCHLVW